MRRLTEELVQTRQVSGAQGAAKWRCGQAMDCHAGHACTTVAEWHVSTELTRVHSNTLAK